jgi:hypothetical protein
MNDAWTDRLAEDLTQALGRPIATVQEAAVLLGCNTATIRDAVRSGELVGSQRVAKGPIRITTRELARYLAAGRIGQRN